MRTAAGGPLPMEAQLVVFVGMFAGLEYLAERRLIHRDVKPATILVVVEGGVLIKVLLADWRSKKLTRTMTRIAGTVAGSPAYMAPDMREADEATGPKSDVFSAGIVMIEVAWAAAQPGAEPAAGADAVGVPEEEAERRSGGGAQPEIVELARRCVVDDQDERADAAEMVGRCRSLVRVAEAPAVRVTLFVRNMADSQRLPLQVSACTSIADVKRRLAEQTGRPAADHQLVFCGRRLEDGRSVDDYNCWTARWCTCCLAGWWTASRSRSRSRSRSLVLRMPRRRGRQQSGIALARRPQKRTDGRSG